MNRNRNRSTGVGIGIGVQSLVDQKLGIVYDVQNIPSWKKVFLKDILESHFNISVFINNDVNCFALGELYYGLGKNLNSFVSISIGTGIAGGIIIDKKLYLDNLIINSIKFRE